MGCECDFFFFFSLFNFIYQWFNQLFLEELVALKRAIYDYKTSSWMPLASQHMLQVVAEGLAKLFRQDVLAQLVQMKPVIMIDSLSKLLHLLPKDPIGVNHEKWPAQLSQLGIQLGNEWLRTIPIVWSVEHRTDDDVCLRVSSLDLLPNLEYLGRCCLWVW